MTKRKKLRLISLMMLVIALIFVACALSNPQLGHTIHIGGLVLDAAVWRAFYGFYAGVMAALFLASFAVKD